MLAMVLLLVTMAIYAQSPEQPSAEIQQKIMSVENHLVGQSTAGSDSGWNILARMRMYGVRGVSIAVIRDYGLEWAKGYGWSDELAKTPVTTRTLFQAASISKSLNAIGVLKLAQENKLDLSADINRYLTNWKFPYDAVSKQKKISTRQLLSHTAGLNVHGFRGYERGTPLPTIIQILNGEPPANSPPIRSMIEPGLRSEYSGGGVTISGQIVMDITREPYARYMQDEVLTPLGMTNSSFEQPNNGDPELLATGYTMDGQEIPGKYHVYPEQAAAGLWTNPTDLAKYIIETQLAYEGRSAKLLNQSMTRLRLTPYLNPTAALGVFIDSIYGVHYFHHSGANEGFRCQYIGSMTGGNGLVIMVNSDNGAIIPEIVNSIAKVYHFPGLYTAAIGKKKGNDSGQRTPMFFIIALILVIISGIAAIGFSRKRTKKERIIKQSTMKWS
jgi:CubicO group peptidase (beta-lactamase class C family)